MLRLTALRTLLFLVALAAVRLVIQDWLLSVAVAFVLSSMAGVPLLAVQRRRLNQAAAERAQRRAGATPSGPIARRRP